MTLPARLRAAPTPATAIRLCIALMAVLLTAWSQWAEPAAAASGAGAGTYPVNEWLRDRFIGLRQSAAPEERILVVDIDESSLARIGPWPWPRGRIAELVEILLGTYAARGVALDIVLPERADAGGDLRLAMLARHGPLVLGQAFDYTPRAAPLRAGQPGGGRVAAAGPAPRASGFIGNHAGLAQAPHVGNMGYLPDPDGTLRRVPLHTYFEARLYPTLALALFDCCAGAAAPGAPGEGLLRVPFRLAQQAFTVVKAADILDGLVAPAAVGGRLALLGSSSLSVGDRVATPLGALTPGLLVHAEVLATLLERQAGRAPKPWPGRALALAFAVALALLANHTLPRLSATANIALLAAAAALWLALAYFISAHDAVFSSAGPLASCLFLLTAAVPFQWQLAQQKSRRLLGTLRQYVAGEVVDELLKSNLGDPLAPRSLQVTTLIADMEGYTTQVESLPVEEAARLTTDFLDCLTRPVLAKRGTLDKYTGDGLVAFWGAPLPNPDHADLALDAAEEIVRAVARLSQARVALGRAPLRVRIGIESGLAMAGDFGTSFRSIYTAVGDSVNTASRLEQAAREFPHDVIVGEGTVGRASRHRFVALGQRLLRGKGKPSTLFALERDA